MTMNEELKKCKNCKNEFNPLNPYQKFCCSKCKDAYWNRKKPDRHKDKHYYSKYNRLHPERLARVGIRIKSDDELYCEDFLCHGDLSEE